MERAARSLGLPLAILEALGQAEGLCDAFLRAVKEGIAAQLLAGAQPSRIRAFLRADARPAPAGRP